MIEKKLHSTKVSGIGYVNFLQNVDYQYNMKGWLTDINSVNFGGLTPTQLAGELGKGLVNQIENQNIEVRLNLAEINNGTYSEIKVEDESKYTEGSTIQTETREEERDIAQDEVLTSNTLTNSIDLSRMGDVVNASNIEQALEDIKTDLQTELINLGVTDATARELVEREVETFYRNTWGATLANDNDNDLYAQHFDYSHFSAANPQYNGNIAASTWRVRGKDKQHYEYSYDDMNRLRSANYKAIDENGNNYNIAGYNMAATYDLNGNIKTMYRKGAVTQDNNGFATAFDVIDNMTYTYANNSNTLLDIQETHTNTNTLSYVHQKGFKGDTPNVTDYIYDANGNLTSDANKNITNITYNHLNLPNVITFGDGNTITWLYDAAGVKLQKQTFEAGLSTTNTHDYIGGIEYQDNVLEAIYTDEGRAKPYGTAYRYEYTIKDHLGNSRVMFCDVDNDGIVAESEIIQEEHYYPFGMKHEGYGRNVTQGENFYQYNGKELNEDFGLDMYDYGARFYDAAVSRWFAVDPLAEKATSLTPFRYGFNNPLRFIDPDGKFEFDTETLERLKSNYPTAYKYLVNTDNKKGSIIELANNEIITSAMIKNTHASNRENEGYSQLTKSQIIEDFTYKKGPKIEINGAPGQIFGNETAGYNGGRKLEIHEDIFQAIEDAENDTDRQAALLLLTAVIMHEYQEDYSDDALTDKNHKKYGIREFESEIYGGLATPTFTFKDGYDDDLFQAKKIMNYENVDKSVIPNLPEDNNDETSND